MDHYISKIALLTDRIPVVLQIITILHHLKRWTGFEIVVRIEEVLCMPYSDVEKCYPDQRDAIIVIVRYNICKQRLDSKVAALQILHRELASCQLERDLYKTKYNQLVQERNGETVTSSTTKYSWDDEKDDNFYTKSLDRDARYIHESSRNKGMIQILCDARMQIKRLQLDLDHIRQRFCEAQGDIKLLREKAKRRQQQMVRSLTQEHSHIQEDERKKLVLELESANEKIIQYERFIKDVTDEKSELEIERDSHRDKASRLNQELNYMITGDDKRIYDIDELIVENRYLKERLKQCVEEKKIALQTVSKLKSALDKCKLKSVRFNLSDLTGGSIMSSSPRKSKAGANLKVGNASTTFSDLQALATSLQETVTDKNTALLHQRRTNRILGARVAELEKKLKNFEIAGSIGLADCSSSIEELEKQQKMLHQRLANVISILEQRRKQRKYSEMESNSINRSFDYTVIDSEVCSPVTLKPSTNEIWAEKDNFRFNPSLFESQDGHNCNHENSNDQSTNSHNHPDQDCQSNGDHSSVVESNS
ncbi:uncharacterized protein TRIADDRAFT_61422 [Trichoplax adhaerens]|uniref:Coiled-coil domain-containing protein 149 n=1 Tax=Trichoplax adhaerens TaxID=10228 RepID=B3SAY2_TRIAD|nr:hypothetical protein TRIADDRAFT_61422 [Trichoplax adhaerens]EDV20010.1 hypothetical protein TRIADDRAFT_61422 [Trichoplax adhaerens]|eukprot:XP_002117394.1 hypothetical protein TRIADDRAFT_61422 [Trichoplax adhaerens]